MPLFLDSEVPSETNNDFNNQITKDVSLGESATSFEDFAINVLQQNSGTRSMYYLVLISIYLIMKL